MRLTSLALGVAGLCVSIAMALLFLPHEGEQGAAALETGVPTAASTGQLEALADERTTPVYWLGALPERKLELTQTSRGVYVRYLPERAEVGDKRVRHLTVATYRQPRARQAALAASRQSGAIKRTAPGGGLAVWHSRRPTSVYLTFKDSESLVEVFDPNPKRAQALALSGLVRPAGAG